VRRTSKSEVLPIHGQVNIGGKAIKQVKLGLKNIEAIAEKVDRAAIGVG
jgi:hypothetical protein